MIKNENKRQHIGMTIIGILLIGVGFAGGWLGFLMFGDIARNCQIVFVSKEAIIRAEEERVKSSLKEDSNNKIENSMFFGKVNEALRLIERVAKSFEDKRTKVLFISSDSGTVGGGYGVSDIVHSEVIKALSKQKKTNE